MIEEHGSWWGRFRLLKLGVSVLIFLSTSYGINAHGDWFITTLDSSGDIDKYTSLALDSMDGVHICYHDWIYGNLKYVTNSEGSWDTITLSSFGDIGMYNSIAVDSTDGVHTSYYASSVPDYSNLAYQTNRSGEWVGDALDPGFGFHGGYPSIALDSNDNPHISYYLNYA